jgi:hypothetical protein
MMIVEMIERSNAAGKHMGSVRTYGFVKGVNGVHRAVATKQRYHA